MNNVIREVEGDILKAKDNIIVHSVNHKRKMGKGLALSIARLYPDILSEEENYMNMCRVLPFEIIRRTGAVAWYKVSENKYIASVFGQEKYGTDKQYTDYVSLGNGLDTVRSFAKANKFSVAIPSGIGCGNGGGVWDIVYEIIQRSFSYSPQVKVTLYKFENFKRTT